MRAAVPLAAAMPILRARIEQVRDLLQEVIATGSPPAASPICRALRHSVRTAPCDVTLPDGARRTLSARAILVATGSRPTHYPGIPFDDPDVYDSDRIYSLRYRPERYRDRRRRSRSASSSPRCSPRSAFR